jgi:hypothetical protein
MNHYEQKQEARRMRLEAAADRARANAAAAFKRADLSEAATGIPFGQPILVGHHSEGRHRATLRRADNAMRRSVEESARARDLAARAASVGTGGISSDDPDAVDKLAEKIAEAELSQAFMRDANKVVRAFYKLGLREAAATADWSRYLEKLRALSGGAKVSELAAAAMLKPDCVGRIGFADYQLSNNGANIKRMKDRLEILKRNQTRETKAREVNGVQVIENADENRLQLVFPGKPDQRTRDQLKAHGFRWSPMAGAWQRQLNNAARYAAECVLRTVAATA